MEFWRRAGQLNPDREKGRRRALLREVITLAWPAILHGLLTTVVFITDRMLLGHYSDVALGSMQVSGPLLWSVFSVFGAFGAGTLAVIGRATGAGDLDRARRTLRSVFSLATGPPNCATGKRVASE